MRGYSLMQAAASALLLPSAGALNIVLNNDDSWATANIRSLYSALKNAGHQVLLVAPVSNQSGKGGSLTLSTAANLSTDGDFGAVTAGSPSWGTDPNDGNIWYYNGTPTSCTFFALDYVVPKMWNGTTPDLLVSGPNEGNNVGIFAYTGSGTIGAAYGAVSRGIPAIAVSASDLNHRYYTAVNTTSDISILAANATVELVDFIASQANSSRLLPLGYGLNVNFPPLNSSCTSPTYTESRMSSWQGVGRIVVNETSGTSTIGTLTDADLKFCINGDCSLPEEVNVLQGCTASVSVFAIDYNAPNSTAVTDIRSLLQPLVSYTNTSSTSTSTSSTTSVPTSGASAKILTTWVAAVTALCGLFSML
ncbi:acid phosphatase [Xylariales sp. PMI_506]|nr:acid phosphatase [Xylariales sp. PMI_506]